MNSAIAKTLSLILLIVVGYFLKSRITSKEQSSGIKDIILGVALPAMIFIALQQIVFQAEMIIIPILALVFNFAMFYVTDLLVLVFNIKHHTPLHRTFKMLVPSLAPGLSCFPFLLEYIGPKTLADAALADIGNKIFVLVILYMFSMRWYYKVNKLDIQSNSKKVVALLQAMLKEPVNFVIIAALIMLSFGVTYNIFPSFLKMSIDRLSLIMTPLILLFIGISVKFNWSQFKVIGAILLCRSGIAFFLSGITILLLQVSDPAMILLIILFPQSSASFWPFAHMSAVSNLEKKLSNDKENTFDLDFAMNILALSLPFSTVLILSVCTFSTSVASNIYFSFFAGGLFILLAIIPIGIRYLRKGTILKAVTADSE